MEYTFKMLSEICMENKRFIESVKTELHFQLLLLFPESNFLKSPAFCESTKRNCRPQSVHDTNIQCTQSVHRFQGQSTGYNNGCFSAVNRVKHLYSDNCYILNVMGIRPSKYG